MNPATPKQRLERLEKAYEVMGLPVKELPVDTFDMNTFGNKTDCGTAACMAGTLSLHPWFRRRGLVGEWRRGSLVPKGFSSTEWIGSSHDLWAKMVSGVFGISGFKADSLITPLPGDLDRNPRLNRDGCVTKATARRRLKVLIDRYKEAA